MCSFWPNLAAGISDGGRPSVVSDDSGIAGAVGRRARGAADRSAGSGRLGRRDAGDDVRLSEVWAGVADLRSCRAALAAPGYLPVSDAVVRTYSSALVRDAWRHDRPRALGGGGLALYAALRAIGDGVAEGSDADRRGTTPWPVVG